ncbi:MAG: hypothetical protein KDC12_02780 [Flavobacteriales bacterium]|nr:hypothetical protein [Flavobacteriales bacterium]
MQRTGYDQLIEKIDQFTRKYYKNRIIRGLIYGGALVLGFYLVVTFLEYFGQFNTGMRTLLFWGFILSTSAVLGYYVVIPLFKLFRMGKTISHEEAATIIGKHFPNVSDKLLNTLQLKRMSDSLADNSLMHAAIDQRIDELKPVPFASAVDFRENKRYIKYIIPPVAVILILLFAAPSILTEPTDRLVRHSEEIVPIAPYSISIVNDQLQVVENEDFLLQVNVTGDVVPDKVYVLVNDQRFKLNKEDKSGHTYLFRNVNQSTPFQFYADGFYSPTYTLETLAAPLLVNFEVALDYPAYTRFTDETKNNSGDITVPAGTRVQWLFHTQNTDAVEVRFSDTTMVLSERGSHDFGMEQLVMKNDRYVIKTRNAVLTNKDSIGYRIEAIPDMYPMIAVDETRDTVTGKQVYFTGDIKDDYGFKRLTFNYIFDQSEDESRMNGERKSIDIPVSSAMQQEQFFHHWDLSELELMPGDKLSYFFEVWDNDGVNGSKSSRTQLRTYAAPTLDELIEQRDEQSKDIKDELEQSLKDAKDIQKDLEELRKDLLNKEELSWQDKKKIEDLLKKQQNLENQVNNIQQQNQQKNDRQNEMQQPNESLMEKQEQLQKLMDEIMSDEMKELMKELERLMEQMDKDDIQKQIEEMDISNEEMEKELDRALEQFKQLEWELKMEEQIDKLEKLAEEQEKLAEESKQEEKESEELKEKQEQLEKEFEEWKKDMDDLEKLNNELENKNSMPDNEQKEQEIDQKMDESKEQLDKDKKKKASESQQGAAEKMKEVAQKMEMMMEQQESESMEEDMKALRALLENIITLSFDQELVMGELGGIDDKDPKYVLHAQTQRKLKDDAKMVEDSLFALSKRVIQLQAPVNREISLVNENMELALENLGERKTEIVTNHQQYVMTSFNNLALLLDDALQQMQKECSNKKPGKGNCEKPGGMGAKPSASQMKKQQQALSDQLQKMKEKIEGFNKGESKSGKGEMSKEIAQMAAKQAAIRKEVEKMSQQLNEDGSGQGNELKKIAKEMEDMEKDMVNQKFDVEMMKRQQDILTRLLKAENAERQREMDNQRKSNEAREYQISNPQQYSDYQKRKEKEIEMLKTLPPTLKPHYKEKVNNYFNKLGD